MVRGEGDTSGLGATLDYDELLAAEVPGFSYPDLDERAAAAMCYTSGTTGNPKGVAYSHRSTYLHSMATHSVQMLPVLPVRTGSADRSAVPRQRVGDAVRRMERGC